MELIQLIVGFSGLASILKILGRTPEVVLDLNYTIRTSLGTK